MLIARSTTGLAIGYVPEGPPPRVGLSGRLGDARPAPRPVRVEGLGGPKGQPDRGLVGAAAAAAARSLGTKASKALAHAAAGTTHDRILVVGAAARPEGRAAPNTTTVEEHLVWARVCALVGDGGQESRAGADTATKPRF